jgi:hypothetical protein
MREEQSPAHALVEASVTANEALDYEAAVSKVERVDAFRLDEAERARRDHLVRLRLVEAGEQLLGALEAAEDDDLWRRLATSDRAASHTLGLTFEQELQLREILAHNIPALLRHLGYATPPPPPAEELAARMRQPLDEVLSTSPDDAGVGTRAAKAQIELIYFVKRFRRLVTAARADLDEEHRMPVPREDRRMRRLLVAGVTTARDRVLPAAIGAGVASWLITSLFMPDTAGTLDPTLLDINKEAVKSLSRPPRRPHWLEREPVQRSARVPPTNSAMPFRCSMEPWRCCVTTCGSRTRTTGGAGSLSPSAVPSTYSTPCPMIPESASPLRSSSWRESSSFGGVTLNPWRECPTRLGRR